MRKRNLKNGFHLPDMHAGLGSKENESFNYYLFRSFLDMSENLCFIMDEAECLLFANISLLKYFEINFDAIGKHLHEILPKQLAQTLHEKFILEWKHGVYDKSIIQSSTVEGKEIIFSLSVFHLTGSQGENLYGGIATDVSEHYQIMSELQECNQKWIAFTQKAFQGVWEWGLGNASIECNESFKKLFGFAEWEQVSIESWQKKVDPEDQRIFLKHVQDLLMGVVTEWDIDYRIIDESGKTKFISDKGLSISQKNTTKLIGSVMDITEIKDIRYAINQQRQEADLSFASSIIKAQEVERNRIGQELHDNVGQLILTSKLVVDMFQPKDNNQQELKSKCKELLMDAMKEIKLLSSELVLPELKLNGLEAAINSLVSDIQLVSPIRIYYRNEVENLESLDACKKITLFRILQEQFKNILKYAKATEVYFVLRNRFGVLEMELKDDGVGFDTTKVRRGVGLTGIFDRTKVCNGNMKIESEPGKGTRLLVVFPFDANNEY